MDVTSGLQRQESAIKPCEGRTIHRSPVDFVLCEGASLSLSVSQQTTEKCRNSCCVWWDGLPAG